MYVYMYKCIYLHLWTSDIFLKNFILLILKSQKFFSRFLVHQILCQIQLSFHLLNTTTGDLFKAGTCLAIDCV